MINTGNPRNAEYIQHAINYIESMPKIHEEISTINPMKIDEERMEELYKETYHIDFKASALSVVIKKYNSTCKDHQVLQPLPENPPDWFNKMFNWASPEDSRKIWSEIINHYGTPTKKELVSVEELAKEIKNIYVPCSEEKKLSYVIAQHLVNKYKLPSQNRKWWMDCEKFVYDGDVKMRSAYQVRLDGEVRLISGSNCWYKLSDCTPYIEPSIIDIAKEKLGEEDFQKLIKEIKNA